MTPPLPKYYELAERIRQDIASGRLQPGDRVSSEPVLTQTYRLSRGTVRQAIQLLESEGLLFREQGKGTFVAPTLRKSQQFSLSSFDESIRKQHRQPSTRVLVNAVEPSSAEVAERLQLEPGTPVFHIQRVRLADGEPVALETRYLAEQLCPDLGQEDLETASLHWLFVHKYDISLIRMEHVVEIRPIEHASADLLQVDIGTPAFYIDRLTFTEDRSGRKFPAVLYEAIYRQDSYAIQTQTL